ncbi:putative serine/threonine-protein phosphatase with EF-hands, partial [Tanacetum coccineum]
MIQRPTYSNHASTRVSLGRMKEALGDCLMVENIDPGCLKPQVKAAQIMVDEAPIAAPRMSVLMDNDHVSCSTVNPTLMGNAVVDRLISTDDLMGVIQTLNENATNEEVKEMMNEVDTNEEGTIDFHDFLNIMSKRVK